MPLKTRSEEIQSAYQNAVNSGESLPLISGGKMGKMVFLGKPTGLYHPAEKPIRWYGLCNSSAWKMLMFA